MMLIGVFGYYIYPKYWDTITPYKHVLIFGKIFICSAFVQIFLFMFNVYPLYCLEISLTDIV